MKSTKYFQGENTCKGAHKLPKIRPEPNDWVYIQGYIDFAPKQKELARVKFEHGQLMMHGYARYGKWKETEFTIGIANSIGSEVKCSFEFKKIGEFRWIAKFIKRPIEA